MESLLKKRGSFEMCESPAERAFVHEMNKHDLEYRQQVWVGRRRLDFLMDCWGKVTVEIDGKEWHDPEQDEKRDAEILESDLVDSIVRIPAGALFYFTGAVKSALHSWYPYLRNPYSIYDREKAEEIADYIVNKSWDPVESLIYMSEGDGMHEWDDNCIQVGNPLSLLAQTHPAWELVEPHKVNLLRKSYFITRTIG